MPNGHNIGRTIAQVIDERYEFDLRRWDTCIHACAMRAMGNEPIGCGLRMHEAAEFLGVDPSTYINLTHAAKPYTRDEACLVLRTLAQTGRVDWAAADRLRALRQDAEQVQRAPQPEIVF